MTKNKEHSRRLLYSLKLSLRMLNGNFQDPKIYQIASQPMVFDQKYKEKVMVECWYRPSGSKI